MITVNKGSFYLSTLLNRLPQKPIVFWDTCAMLDILRIADREDVNTYNNYQYILQKIADGDLISVTSEMVLHEYNSNAQEVENEFRRKQIYIHNDVKKYCAFLNNQHSIDIQNNIDNLDVITLLNQVSERLWSQTFVIREQKKFQQFAHFRTKHKFAPARKKGEYKDCYIWGSCLQLANRRPFPIPFLFFTKNIDDFCDINNKRVLDAQIQNDCNTSGVKILLNSGLFRGELNLIGL